MADLHDRESSSVPDELAEQLRTLVRQFQSSLEAGQSPRIEDFLAGQSGAARKVLLRDLLRCELATPGKAETAAPEEYCQRFPDDADVIAEIFSGTEASSHSLQATVSMAAGAPPRDGAATAAAVPQDGRRLGHFQIVQTLGQGSYGKVYRAHDLRLDREVALKIPRPGTLIDEQDVRQFLREARAAGQLRHPNIVPIYDAGQIGETCYIAGDFVSGKTLRQEIQGGNRLPVADAVRVVVQLARALHYAHGKGIIHRDIKPENVMIDAEGTPHLMDFGLARRETGDELRTQEGVRMGTPAYMSPEQHAGRSHLADARSDLWSLGVMLYELLALRRPFSGQVNELAAAVAERQPEPPRRLVPSLSKDLDTICLKCLAKQPGERYATCGELADELERWLRGEPIKARPVGLVERSVRWSRRNPVIAALGTAVLVVLITGLAVSTYFYGVSRREAQLARQNAAHAGRNARTAQRNAEDARAQRDKAERQTELARRRERTARWNAYVLAMNQAYEQLQAGWIGRALELLEAQIPQPGQEDLRDYEWYFLWQRCHSEEAVLRGHEKRVNWITFSLDGGTLASCSHDRTVRLWDVAERRTRAVLTGPASAINCVAFSPAGDLLAGACADGTVTVWNLRSNEPVRTLPVGVTAVTHVAFSPDGRLLAAGAKTSGGLKLWETENWQEWFATKDTGALVSLAFSPAGKMLATGGDDVKVRLWDPEEGRKLAEIGGWAKSMVFSANGQRLLVAPRTYGQRGWGTFDFTSDRWIESDSGAGGHLLHLALSPNDRYLVLAGGTSGGTSSLQEWDVTEEELLSNQNSHTGEITCVDFSPDGATYASAASDGTVRLWSVDNHTSRDEVRGHTDNIYRTAVSPDGATIATASKDGNVRLWDAATGRPTRTLPHGATVFDLAFSPDGRQLATVTLPDDSMLRVFDIESGQPLVSRREEHGVFSVAFAPEGRGLAFGGNGCVHLLRLDGSEFRCLGKVHESWVSGLAFSPDGTRLASASFDKTAALIDVTKNEVVHRFTGHTERIWDLDISPDGKYVATASSDGTARVWDTAQGAAVATLKAPSKKLRMMFAVAFSRDGTLLATGTNDLDTSQVNVATIDVWNTSDFKRKIHLEGRIDTVRSLAFFPDGKSLVSSGEHPVATVWDLEHKTELRHLGRRPDLWSAAYSPDEKYLAIGSYRTVQILDAKMHKRLHALGGHEYFIYGVAFSPDGKWFVSIDGGSDTGTGAVKIWETETWNEVKTFKPFDRALGVVAFSPHGKYLAVASKPEMGRFADWVGIWSTGDWKLRQQLKHPGALGFGALAFSPDGRLLATGATDYFGTTACAVTLWDIEEGERLTALPGHTSGIYSLLFVDDGNTLVSGSRDGTLRVWDAHTGMHRRTLQVGSMVSDMFLVPGTDRVVGGCLDQSLRIWETADWQQLARFRTIMDAPIRAVRLSPDNQRVFVVSGALDGAGFATSWDIASPEGILGEDSRRAPEPAADGTDDRLGKQAAALEQARHAGTISAHLFYQGSQLLHRPKIDLSPYDEQRRALFERSCDGELDWRELSAQLDALETPAEQDKRRQEAIAHEIRTSREKLIAERLAFAAAHSEGDRHAEALAAVKHVLRLDPAHREARQLRAAIEQRDARRRWTNSLGMEFVEVRPGRFWMGSPPGEADRDVDETLRLATVTDAFMIATHEVTRGQFARFVEATGHHTEAEQRGEARSLTKEQRWPLVAGLSWREPGFDQDDDHPAVCISWQDATAFCKWLSQSEAKPYRLPTETEWEFACRAGTHTAFIWGDKPEEGEGWGNLADAAYAEAFPDDGAASWSDGHAYTAPVGRFRANAWGLYDVVGNAAEWCADPYGCYRITTEGGPEKPPVDARRVLRGAAWSSGAPFCRSAMRRGTPPDYVSTLSGFRVVLDEVVEPK